MTIPAEPGQQRLVGRTVLTSRALQRVAHGAARDAAQVTARDVSVALHDDGGVLRAEVTVPVALGGEAVGTLPERGAVIQRAVIEGMDALAGRRVGSVNVRFSSVRRAPERRVS